MARHTARERAAHRQWRSIWLLCCTIMAQHGGTSSAHGETPTAAQSPHAPGMLTCMGVRPGGVRPESTAAFMHMCRVLDTAFSPISADILLELHAQSRDPAAKEAFNVICARAGPDVAPLFDRAVTLQSKGSRRVQLHEVMATDRSLAATLHAAAARVHAAWGGLYEGKLDCLRSTLCNPAFGLNSSGSCAVCCIILKDANFNQRLRRCSAVQASDAGGTTESAHAETTVRSAAPVLPGVPPSLCVHCGMLKKSFSRFQFEFAGSLWAPGVGQSTKEGQSIDADGRFPSRSSRSGKSEFHGGNSRSFMIPASHGLAARSIRSTACSCF